MYLWAECVNCGQLFQIREGTKAITSTLNGCPKCGNVLLIISKKKIGLLTYDPRMDDTIPTVIKKKWKIREKGKLKPRVKSRGGHRL